MSRWFRHYAGLCRDEKLVRVALRAKQPIERVVWVWAAILESASEVNDNGRYDFDAGEAAYFLRADEGDVVDIVNSLEFMGRVCACHVAKWSDRQFNSDTSAERQKRYRDRQKLRTEDNADSEVTSPLRNGDAPETETETETEQKEGEANASLVVGVAADPPAEAENVVKIERKRASGGKSDAVRAAGDWWNELAAHLELKQIDAIKPGSTRETHTWARCRDLAAEFGSLSVGLTAYGVKIRGSPFILGQVKSFRATFDWVINQANFQKIMEGNYEDFQENRAASR